MPGTPLRLIVGLGNPGPEYALTRHNVGFWLVDALARANGTSFRAHSKFHAETCRIQIAQAELTLLKSTTFMNRSGLAVRAVADYLQVPPAEILVVHDELDLPVGSARFKFAGGHGGHNGLRDTIAHLGAEFWRLRIGIDHPGDKSQVVDYVLHRATKEDEQHLLKAVANALEFLPTFIQHGAEKAMNGLHRRKSDE